MSKTATKRDRHANSLRTNLIMRFACAECGSILDLSYEGSAATPANYNSLDRSFDREPTGAAVRYVPTISIEPCQACIEKHTGPAKQLSEALKTLIKP